MQILPLWGSIYYTLYISNYAKLILQHKNYKQMNTIDLHELTGGLKDFTDQPELVSKTRRYFKTPIPNHKFDNKHQTLHPERSISICDKASEIQKEKRKIMLPYLSNIPKLSSARERSSIDKSYLQQWLDSSLAEEQTNVPLRSIKKYQIDKKNLIGQNLSSEEIDKLYHSLYVYTHGIKKLFEDILGGKDHLIMKFWKVFLKLLQKSSQYDSIFRIIDLRHQKDLEELRQSLRKREQEFVLQRKSFEQKEQMLLKQINSRKQEIAELISEKNILESNFLLTDQAFNEEVTLRLKFQQKINHINTAYSELKHKYLLIVEEVKIYKEEKIIQMKKQKELVDQLNNTKIKVKQLEKTLLIQKQKMKFKDVQIQEARQEAFDVKQDQLAVIKNQQNGEIELQKYISREKNYKFRLNEEIQFRQSIQKTLKEKTKELEIVTVTLHEQRTRLYKEYKSVELYKEQINEKIKIIKQKDYEIEELNKKITQLNLEIKLLTQKQILIVKQKEKIQKECEFNNRKILGLRDNLQANEKIIQDLRNIREKYQKMNNILTEQHKTLLKSLNEANSKIVVLREEIRDNLITIQGKQFTATQISNRLQAKIDLEKSKLSSIQNQLAQKDKNISSLEQKMVIIQKESDSKNPIIEKLKNELYDQKNQITKEIYEKKKLEGKIVLYEEEIKKYKDQLEKMIKSSLQTRRSIFQLESKNSSMNYILEEKKKNKEQESNAIKYSLLAYKKHIEERAQYMHPMLFWDLQAQNQRLVETFNRKLKRYSEIDKQIQELNNTIGVKEKLIANFHSQLQQSKIGIIKLEEQILIQKKLGEKKQAKNKMNEEFINKLETKLKQKDFQYIQLQKKCDHLDTQYREIVKKKLEGVHQELQTALTIDHTINNLSDQHNIYFLNSLNSSTSRKDELEKEKQKQKQIQKNQKSQKDLVIKQETNVKQHEDTELSEQIKAKYGNEKNYQDKEPLSSGLIRKNSIKITNKQFTSALKIAYMRKVPQNPS